MPTSSNGIIIATGPSLNGEQLAWAFKKKFDEGWRLFGVNNVYQIAGGELDEFLACNPEWWQEYGEDPLLRSLHFKKWTWDRDTYLNYHRKIPNVRYIEGRWGPSLSKDPEYIHYGHASGYQILGIAYHAGIRNFFLLGYDMAYPPGQKRHYFGEYPKALYHNPRTGPRGEFTGLIKQFETIDEKDLGIKVINLCPTSALDHFAKGTIDEY